MKILTALTLLLFVGLLNSSCKQKLCSLKITLDSTFDYKLLDSMTLSSERFKIIINPYDQEIWSYDSVYKTRTLQLDSLQSAEYVFVFKTKFNKSQLWKFTLASDSVIHQINTLAFNNAELIDKTELLNADTIEVLYISEGCFHNYSENSLLVKNKKDNNYVFTSNISPIMEDEQQVHIMKEVSSDIIDTLVQFQIDSKKQEDRITKAGTHYMNTTHQYFYLLVKNKLYRFNDVGLSEWNLYDKLKKNFAG